MREILIAPDGYMFTDGEIYGKRIYLAIDRSKDEFYLITREEYEEILDDIIEDNQNEIENESEENNDRNENFSFRSRPEPGPK